MRPVVEYRSASNEAFEEFCHSHPGIAITKAQFRAIIYHYNQLLVSHVLESGDKVKLPFGLGEIAIAKYRPPRFKTFVDKAGSMQKIDGLPINWKQTKAHGKLIYHLNAHTDGYRFRWKWFHKNARFELARCFTFRAGRVPARLLGQYLKNDPQYAQRYRQWT